MTWNDPAFIHIARVAEAHSGLTFPQNRRSSAELAIRRSMAKAGFRDAASYASLIERDGLALDDLMAELTIGETYFFREPAAFGVIRELTGQHRGPLRAWSAACATGEEAYSLAIAIQESGVQESFVLGTDISRRRLAAARHGSYRRWSMRGVPLETERQYFKQHGDDLILSPAVRKAVDFRYLNLAEDIYPSLNSGVWGMDLILCRNVLIYFSTEVIARVARRLIDSLADGGWLLLGASDPMLSDYVRCEVVSTPSGIAYRRAGARGGIPGFAVVPVTQTVAADPEPDVVTMFWPEPAVDVSLPNEIGFDGTPAVDDVPLPARLSTSDVTVGDPLGAYERRNYELAAELARKAVDSGHADARTRVVLVRSLANLGRLSDAGKACASAIDLFRSDAELHYLHAILLIEGGHAADAVDAARRSIYLDRRLVVAHLALANAQRRAGRADAADRALRAAEKLLDGVEPESVVPASDGEHVSRMLQVVRTHRRLLTEVTV